MARLAEERLGNERMLPLVFKMALPAVLAQLVNLLYNVIDRVYIGHIEEVGKNALAGVGITSSVIMLIAAFGSLVGGGGAPLMSIALGRGDRKGASQILNNGFVMTVFFAVICTLVPYFVMEPMLRFAGASDATLPFAVDYLSIYLIGSLFVLISFGLNQFISAQGRPGAAMCSVLIGAVANTALDPLFIFGFGLGIKGAAIATVISQGLSATFVLIILSHRRTSVRLSFADMKPSLSVMGKRSALGISPFVMASTESVVGFALNGQLYLYGGDIHVSALSIMQSAMQIVSVPLSGFAHGVVPILGYNYGHGRPDRVRSCFAVSLLTVFGLNLFGMVTMILIPRTVASAFSSDAVLIETVGEYMPLFLAGMTIFGLQRVCQNTFVALGQAKISLFIALLRKIFLLVPLAYILPRFFADGVSGVYAAEAIADATAAIICTVIFFSIFSRILARSGAREQNQS